MRRMLLIGVLFAGCASASSDAGPGATDADPGSGTVDAELALIDGAPDAPPDAYVPQPITITQSTSPAMVSGNTLVCGQAPYTLENHYYRVFPLADHGIAGEFQVQNVQFGVEHAQGSHTLTVNVGTYSGAVTPTTAGLDAALWTPIASTSIGIPDGDQQTINVPIAATIPAGGKLMVELASPNSSDRFWPSSNASGETYPTYRRTTCANTIQSYAATGITTVHLVMNVSGLR
ncbi:MAG: hypothetical protein WKG01_21945 [Kofleriaceae bacterium]